MKKPYPLALIAAFLIIALGVIFFILNMSDEPGNWETIAQQQEVTQSVDALPGEEKEYISPKKQKQLDQITDAYSDQERVYRESVARTMQKYNSNFSQSDSQEILTLIETSATEDALADSIKTKFNIGLLKADIQKMMVSYKELLEEKDLKLTRLESFQERNNSEIDSNTQSLIQLSINESLRQNSTLSSREISSISREISQNLFKTDSYIFSQDSYELQIGMIQDELSTQLKDISSLSSTEKLRLIKIVGDDISSLQILSAPVENDQLDEISDDSTSFFPLKNGLKYLSSFVFPVAFADEPVTLSSEERQILILKTEIFIDRILQESIGAEIEYNAGSITQINYENIIEDNLIELEELVILKESLENDPDAISLGDIQRFNLGAYVDDSEMIEELPVLAYIQNKSGHIVIHNLNGSAKLGEENMSLYSGYSIETLSNSDITLIFSDESILRLDPLSKVTISSPSGSNINVGVERGVLWSRVLKPLLSGDTFSIDVDGVSLGVRGTSLSVSKQESSTSIQIVDSFTSDGSASVELRDGAGTTSSVMPGKQISIDAAGNASVSDKSRVNLLSENLDIGNFIKEDLAYLTLLIDDRNRGFYNTPIITKNDGKKFLDKLMGELEVSIPNSAEKAYIIQNSELHSELVNTGSIYGIIKRDEIITAIKQNPNGNTSTKITAVKNLDMLTLEKDLGSKRAIEDLFNYNIIKDITDKTTFTTGQLKEIFTGFPLEETQDKARLLSQAKQELTVNGGSSIVTEDITLDLEDGDVDITWKSVKTDIISDTGRAPPRVDEASTILTATLTIGNLTATKDFGLTVVPREASPFEELEAAEIVLREHISNFEYFDTRIIIQDDPDLHDDPDFLAEGVIKPRITFTVIDEVNSNGTINQPRYTPEEIEDLVSELDEGTDIQSIPLLERDNINLSDLSSSIEEREYKQVEITATLTHQLTGETYPAGPYTIQIKKRDPRDQILAELQDIEYCALKLGDDDCYELVAEANYDEVGEFKLINQIGGSDITPSAPNVNLNTCSGTQPNGSDPTDTLSPCGWVNTSIIANMYDYEISKIGNFDPIKSWLEYDDEKGIVLDNVNREDSTGKDALIYDLSSLELGTDWAIEMSVRGEDLKRNDLYYLLAFNSSHSIFINNGNLQVNGFIGSIGSIDPNKFYSLHYTYSGNKIAAYLGDILLLEETVMNVDASKIYLGSSRNQSQQWNGIINNINILK